MLISKVSGLAMICKKQLPIYIKDLDRLNISYMIYLGKETSDGYEVNGIMALPLLIEWLFYFVISEGFD